jgi:hypothetical protein
LYAPWQGGLTVRDAAGQLVATARDAYGRAVFPTTAGETYTLAAPAARDR